MRHVYWVIDGLLAGRPGPVLEPWDPAELYKAGFRTVISLAAEEDTEDLAPYGLLHHRASFPPVVLFSTGMRKAFIHQTLPVWRLIDEQMTLGRPTLLHCHAGQDRTGAILAGYLIVYEGQTPTQALRRLRKVKRYAMTAEGYKEVLGLLRPGEIPDPRGLL